MGRVGNFLASLQQNRIVTEADMLVASLALGAATNEELNELKNNLKPKQNMKLTELKKMIQAEITNILSEAGTKTAPAKPQTDTETAPKTAPGTPSRTAPGRKKNPKELPKDKAEDAAKKIAEKIGNRYDKMLKNKK
jgi:hypothetical protein